MDRQTALDILEAVRPGTADEAEPEVLAAVEAVRHDRAAAATLARRQDVDCRIAAAMQDVAVPPAAKAQLLARMLHAAPSLAAEPAAANPPAETAVVHEPTPVPAVASSSDSPALPGADVRRTPPSNRRLTRRHVLRAAAAVALLVLIAAGFLWRQRASGFGPTVTLDQIARSVPTIDVDPQPFTGRFEPSLPATSGWSNVRFAAAPQAVLVGDPPQRQAAAYPFAIAVRRGQTVQGWILTAPVDRVSDPPPADSFQLSSVRYENGLASVAWTEGKLVYVCVVRGGEEALRVVEWALDRRFS